MLGPMLRVAVLLALFASLALTAACGDGAGGDSAAQQPPAPTPAPAEPTPPPVPEPEPVRFTISTSGDLLPHMPVVDRAQALARDGRRYDFAPMFRALRPIVRRADLALCHVETPLVPGAPAGYPLFRTPPELARAIRATGWDACSTASNHSVDAGQAGVDSTVRALDRAGVAHTGTAVSERSGRRVLMRTVRGVRVALLAYTAHTNGLIPPHPWSVNLARADRIVADARRARRAGARVVVVNLHWGTEYAHEPDADQKQLADRVMRSRAVTAIVGQHAHVVQPIRRVHGRWVVFGTGNLLSNQSTGCCPAATQDGVVATLHVRVDGARARVERMTYAPTWVRHPDYAVLPVARALRAGQADAGTLRASWQRTVDVIGRSRGLRPQPARLPD
jgi:poly-gamma-glutamate synthesis protein (capsule biosynthesis protein)